MSLNVIVYHLPIFIKHLGPISGYWMYPFERFNSWISRRVKNRRYLEATVMQTYRIFEWSLHLQMSGKLPTSFSLTNLFAGSNEIGDDEETGNPDNLDLCQLEHIRQYYRLVIPEYKNLCSRCNKEREAARKRHELKHFPPLCEWIPSTGPPLSQTEQLLCCGPAKEICAFNTYYHKSPDGRIIRFSSENTMTSSTSSTVISIQTSPEFCFESIHQLFSHSFLRFSHVFAYINWYGSVEVERTSSLYSVCTKSSVDRNPIVPVSELIRRW